ncbi:MAG: sulfotransferase [Xanthomonadaceae bacterium]|nr:sulfotransferase [Xanthomonadaceae bacterium]MDE1961140.1 sulfotransferase [Xanthomonadaceae bacterium]MDE2084516.1 sulfotransferase [Xanthomonadaceae bacterium]
MNETSDRHWNRAQRYLAQGQPDAARTVLESFVRHSPQHVPAHLTLSMLAWNSGRVRDATRHALDAARTVPEDPVLLGHVAGALLQVGEVVAARACLDRAALTQTGSVPALLQAAAIRYSLNENAAALALYDRAGRAGADGAEFRFQRGMQLAFNGRMDEADTELHACLRHNPAYGRASLELARLRKQTADHNHLAFLDAQLQRVQPGSYDHAAVEFARYKELEDLGRYDEAWDALAHGNALMYARHRHDADYSTRLFKRLTDICTTQFLQPGSVVHPGAQPIFILGMPRSGTTLLDRILGNHSQVASAGELDTFALQLRWCADHPVTLDETVLDRLPGLDFAALGRRYLAQAQWRAQGKPLFTDKLPRNWMLAGPIARALPQARIVHMVRDPVDVCFSNYRVLFADAFAHVYDLDALASHYRTYRRTMAHWHAAMPGRILDVSYRDLVHDPEGTTRRVLDFCGLAWEPRLTDTTRNRTAVDTLSMAQVREPVHTRFVDSWRRYERQLAPLAQALQAPD